MSLSRWKWKSKLVNYYRLEQNLRGCRSEGAAPREALRGKRTGDGAPFPFALDRGGLVTAIDVHSATAGRSLGRRAAPTPATPQPINQEQRCRIKGLLRSRPDDLSPVHVSRRGKHASGLSSFLSRGLGAGRMSPKARTVGSEAPPPFPL